jgi:P4 family phage/plasmid primase-like protien
MGPGVNCLSGIIRIDVSGKPYLTKHSPEDRFRHKIDAHWPPRNGRGWRLADLLMKLLMGCFQGTADCHERIKLLQEFVAVAAFRLGFQLQEPKALILYGPRAGNGKSQVLELMRGLLPSTAVSAVPPNRFNDDKFVAELAGKLLNAADELSNSTALTSDRFKAIVTGEPTLARAVYSQPFSFRPMAQHAFATNALPPIRGGADAGLRRRLMILQFDRVIPPGERIPNIGRRIGESEADQLLDFAVEGAAQVARTGTYSVPPSSQEALRSWFASVDPVVGWLEQAVDISDPSAVVRTRAAYDDFQNWTASEGYHERALPWIAAFTRRVQSAGKGITTRRLADGSYFVGMKVMPRTPTRRSSLLAVIPGRNDA